MGYVNQHEAAVAKQQAETWKKAFETPDSLEILLGMDDKVQRKGESGIATLGEVASTEVILYAGE